MFPGRGGPSVHPSPIEACHLGKTSWFMLGLPRENDLDFRTPLADTTAGAHTGTRSERVVDASRAEAGANPAAEVEQRPSSERSALWFSPICHQTRTTVDRPGN